MGTQNCASETVEDGIGSYHLPRANYTQLFPTWYFEKWHWSIHTTEMGKWHRLSHAFIHLFSKQLILKHLSAYLLRKWKSQSSLPVFKVIQAFSHIPKTIYRSAGSTSIPEIQVTQHFQIKIIKITYSLYYYLSLVLKTNV